MKGLIGLDQNFTTTISVNRGEGGGCSNMGTTGTSAGEYWFTQATSGTLAFYGVGNSGTDKVNNSNGLSSLSTTQFPMISYVRYTGETGFGEGTGGGGSVTLTSADPNVSTMIGGTAQTMTTTSFEIEHITEVKRIDYAVNNTRVGDWQNGEGLNTGGGYDNTFIGAGNARYMTTGKENTVVGQYNCFNWDTNSNIKNNVVLGFKNAYYRKGPMYDCVVIGKEALMGDTTSPNNTGELYRHVAIGLEAMQNWRRATYDNVAIGAYALHGSSTITNNYGCNNIAIGRDALRNTWHMSNQVAIGYGAGLSANCAYNLYIGTMAGAYNTNATGHSIFMGDNCGARNNGCYNIALGKQALNGWTGDGTMRAGDANVAIGYQCALRHNGHNNVFLGSYCGNQAVSVPHASTHYNTCVGSYAGRSLNQTLGNTFIGYHAGFTHSNPGANKGYNTCVGYSSGQNISTGYDNTYMGHNSGFSTTTGFRNIAIGEGALFANTGGDHNVTIGYEAGRNVMSDQNVLIGYYAGRCNGGNSTGHNNVCIGQTAGFNFTSGYNNVMIGRHAGYGMTTGYNNVCIGYNTGRTISTGYHNTCVGYGAGYAITTGDENTCVGRFAGYGMTTGESNIYIGHNANYYTTTGKYNIAIGRHAGCANGTGSSEGDYKLYIGTNETPNVTDTYGDSSYIYGYMKMNDNPFIAFNCDVGIGTTSPDRGLCILDNQNTGQAIGNYYIGYHTSYQEPGALKIFQHLPIMSGSYRTSDGGGNADPAINIVTNFVGSGANSATHQGGCIQWTNQSRDNPTSGSAHGQAYAAIYGGRHSGYSNYEGEMIFYTSDTTNRASGRNLNPRMTIKGGNVGIGTTSPLCALHIEMPLPTSSYPMTIPSANSTSFGVGVHQFLSSRYTDGNFNQHGLVMGTDGTCYYLQHMSTNHNNYYNLNLNPKGGKVGIGTDTPGYQLTVKDIGFNSSNTSAYMVIAPKTNGYAQFETTYAGWNGKFLCGAAPMGNSSGQNNWVASYACVFTTNGNLHLDSKTGSYTMYLNYYSGGDVHAAGAVRYSSDDRLKHNEKEVVNALDVINKLDVLTYFKSQKKYAENHNYELDNSGNPITDDKYHIETGLIAQKVKEIPELEYCVSYTDTIYEDDDYSDYFVNYNDIFCFNITATQELDKKVIALETKNTELENEVATLKTELAAIKQHLGI